MLDDHEIVHAFHFRVLDRYAAVIRILEHRGRDRIDRAIARDNAELEIGRPEFERYAELWADPRMKEIAREVGLRT